MEASFAIGLKIWMLLSQNLLQVIFEVISPMWITFTTFNN